MYACLACFALLALLLFTIKHVGFQMCICICLSYQCNVYTSYLFCSPKWQGYFVYQAWHLLHLVYDVFGEMLRVIALQSIGLWWAYVWLSCFNKLRVPGNYFLSCLDQVARSM